ncbi:hypothetical protein ABKN59_011215 [Abortiporus biennis]
MPWKFNLWCYILRREKQRLNTIRHFPSFRILMFSTFSTKFDLSETMPSSTCLLAVETIIEVKTTPASSLPSSKQVYSLDSCADETAWIKKGKLGIFIMNTPASFSPLLICSIGVVLERDRFDA